MVNTASQPPRLNPHLTKSRLNDALCLCEMNSRNFFGDGDSRSASQSSHHRWGWLRTQPGRGTRWNQSGCGANDDRYKCLLRYRKTISQKHSSQGRFVQFLRQRGDCLSCHSLRLDGLFQHLRRWDLPQRRWRQHRRCGGAAHVGAGSRRISGVPELGDR